MKPKFRYPYMLEDEREDLTASNDVLRVLRGGAYFNNPRRARCAYRHWDSPNYANDYYGMRVVVLLSQKL